mgnify:CR=1 FL=1
MQMKPTDCWPARDRVARWIIPPLALLAASSVGGWSAPAQATGLNSGPWPMFHRSATHDARTTGVFPATAAIAWTNATGDTIEYSSPVIASDGTIYVGNKDNELVALTPGGSVKWVYGTNGNIRYSTPAIADDGTVYVGSADGKLYAIRSNGTLRWATPTGGAVKTSPAIAPDGTIYAGSDDKKLWAFRADGTVKWSFATGDTIRSSPTIGADGAIYFGSNDRKIYAVEPTGVLRWAATTGGPVKASPAIGQGADVIVGSYDGFLYSISAGGTLQWVTFLADEIRSSAAIGIQGKIYLSLGTKLTVVGNDGDLAWDRELGSVINSTPAVHTRLSDSLETVVVGAENGRFYAVERNAGIVWQALLGSPIRSSAAIANGRVYVCTLAGSVVCFGAPVTTDVEAGPLVSAGLVVSPNPFMSGERVTLRYAGGMSAPAPDGGRILVTDVTGRLVRTLALSGESPAVWDGADAHDRPVAAGVYLYRWELGDDSGSGRVVSLR